MNNDLEVFTEKEKQDCYNEAYLDGFRDGQVDGYAKGYDDGRKDEFNENNYIIRSYYE